MKILLADDDSAIIQACLPVLKGTGHEIHVALSGEKAIERISTVGALDLLITDVVMDPMDGFTLREQLAGWFPALKTIFISGYDLSEYGERLAGAHLLSKPFGPEELLAAIAKVFEPVDEPAPVHAVAAAFPEAPPEPEVIVPASEPESVAAVAEAVPEATPVPEVAVPAVEPVAAVVQSELPLEAAAPMTPAEEEFNIPPAPPLPPSAPAVARPVAVPVAARPVAVPRATVAVPRAVPVAKPSAIAAPKAVPTVRAAAPVAAPKAVPVARPSVAAPVARPAVAAATVKAVAAPVAKAAVPVARPAAVPVARPAAASVARPVAAPTARPAAVPVARAAVPTARPAAAPVAKAAAARPVAKPVATVPAAKVPTFVPVRAAAPAVAAPLPEEEDDLPPVPPASTTGHLIGETIGGYKIVSHLGDGHWGGVYAAVQVSINRAVGLKLLDPTRTVDEGQKMRFIADARAKAHVQHPGILSVYEAGSADEWIFYTQEYVDGHSLEDIAAQGWQLDEPTALKLLKAAADCLLYLTKSGIPHTPLRANDVYLGVDGQPRVSNLATQLSDQPASAEREIERLGRALLLVAAPDISTGLRALLARTQRTSPAPVKDWGLLLNAVKALEPKVIPLEADMISAQERAQIATVEKARKQQRRSFIMSAVALGSLLLLSLGAVYFVWFNSNERKLDEQVRIPAGDFISGESTNSTTGEFWIDKYEVTIGQYANFVRWLEAHEGEKNYYDHPDQPRGVSHIPEHWKIYFSQAYAGGKAHKVPISLNAPMLEVNWWDAYAYAKWLNRELPTELEWEKAARGTKGVRFPWGDDEELKKANTGADYDYAHPEKKGGVDGFNYWSDVDGVKADKSYFNVVGMAGNVSEWTATWANKNANPVIKGGNFTIPLQPLSARIDNRPPSFRDEFVGFRTISRTPPKK